MPKILRIINRFNLGGPTYNAAYLTKYLPDTYETLLVGGEKDETEDSSQHILDQLGIEPIIVQEMQRSIHPANDYIAYKKIKKIIDEFKPDIVHTHASKAGTLGRLAAFSSKVPVIVHTFHGHVFHSYFNKTKTAVFKKIEQNLAKRSSCIVAISEKQREELALVHKIAPFEKFAVIPLGFDLTRFQEDYLIKRTSFRKAYNIQEDEVAIGIIGRLVPVKNHALFLQALQVVLQKTTQKVRAFIVGDGEDREKIRLHAQELGIPYIEDNFDTQTAPLCFTSWIKEIDHVNAGMDIVALCSLNEGTPVSLIEAQASGTPIVSTNVGGIENIVLDKLTGLLSELEDVEQYAENLLTLVENENMRLEMQKYGWKHVKDQFSYQRLVKDMDALYTDLLAKVK
jgi:glycosyltransferase involved in cell wall biosynthesis